MTETQTVTFESDGKVVSFDLYHDATYIPDAIIKQYPITDLEPELWRFLMRALRPGDTVVDAGANVGLFTLLMSSLVGPTGTVHAFEPHPDTAMRLDTNILLNRFATNVVTHEQALWDCRRDLTLYTCFEPGLASLRPYDGWTGSRTVRTDRLDHVLVDPPRLIKMDIEGAELTALKGCDKWLAQVPYVTTELSRQNLAYHAVTPELVATYMSSYGKDLWFLDPDGKMPRLIDRGARWPDAAVNQMGLFATEPDVQAVWETHDAAT